MNQNKVFPKIVKYWLILGCFLLFFQIIIGGITRITGSGLSITKWDIVIGTLPPLNEVSWNDAFDLYKETPQYQKINEGMSMSDFKFIFFWEFLHRLWARVMGFIFLFPFIGFMALGYFDKRLIKLLCAVFVSAGLAALFGWIMVASGLVERPWVNAYKLSLHLGIALLTMGFLLWSVFYVFIQNRTVSTTRLISKLTNSLFVLICVQIFLGAIMSGSRSALVFPSWPDIGGELVPKAIFIFENWTFDNFNNYDQNLFFPSLIHLLHRTTGYVVFFFGLFWFYNILKINNLRSLLSTKLLILVLISQVVLGIITLIMCKGNIPVFWGVLHQGVAIILFSLSLFHVYLFRTNT